MKAIGKRAARKREIIATAGTHNLGRIVITSAAGREKFEAFLPNGKKLGEFRNESEAGHDLLAVWVRNQNAASGQ